MVVVVVVVVKVIMAAVGKGRMGIYSSARSADRRYMEHGAINSLPSFSGPHLKQIKYLLSLSLPLYIALYITYRYMILHFLVTVGSPRLSLDASL